MKNLKSLMALCASLLMALSVSAQPQQQQNGERPTAEAMAKQRVERLADLNLSEAQQKSVYDLYLKYMTEMMESGGQRQRPQQGEANEGGQQQRQQGQQGGSEEMQKKNEELTKSIMAVLNDDQKAKFTKLQEEEAAQRQQGGGQRQQRNQ